MGGQQSIEYHPAAKNRVFKLKRDAHDHEHQYWQFADLPDSKLPSNVDLSVQFPPIYDQGKLGSCTANATCAAFQYECIRQGEPDQTNPSRLFEYYKARATQIPPTIKEDSGSSLGVSVLCLFEYGVCDEKDWPYDITKFTVEPPKEVCEKATHHKCIVFKRVLPTHQQIQHCLSLGYPIVFGIAVYDSMMTVETGKTGMIPMPKTQDQTVDGKTIKAETLQGGHAIVCVGYDRETKLYKIRNSWSEAWGDKGYGYLPFEYMVDKNLAYDMWSIRLVKSDNEAPEAKK